FSSRRRHTRFSRDWSSDVCSSDLITLDAIASGFHFITAAIRVITTDVQFAGAVDQVTVHGGVTDLATFALTQQTVFRLFRFFLRSEERRVGKACRSRGGLRHENRI